MLRTCTQLLQFFLEVFLFLVIIITISSIWLTLNFTFSFWISLQSSKCIPEKLNQCFLNISPMPILLYPQMKFHPEFFFTISRIRFLLVSQWIIFYFSLFFCMPQNTFSSFILLYISPIFSLLSATLTLSLFIPIF